MRSREHEAGGLVDAALTPRHSAGLVGMWESEDAGRVGLEVYYTGEQRLEVNPYRSVSRPYVIVGLLGERRFGRWRLFVNAENLTDVRQTRWDSLLRPSRGVDGRWTVDAWAPLDGRVINGGIRATLLTSARRWRSDAGLRTQPRSDVTAHRDGRRAAEQPRHDSR